MRVERSFAPMRIEIQTKEDLHFFQQLVTEVRRHRVGMSLAFGPNYTKTSFELALDKFETELFL